MIIAVVVILAAVIGLFIYSNMELEQESLQDVCDNLAESINDASSTDGELKLRFTFSRDSEAMELPATVNGEDYEIQITSRLVILSQDGKDPVMSDLLNPVHLFPPPNGGSLSLIRVQRADLLVENLTFRSGTDFYIENRLYNMPGPEHPTFCYVKVDPAMIASATVLENEISEISSYSAMDELNDTKQITLEHDCTFAKDVVVLEGRYAAFPLMDHFWKPDLPFETTKEHLNSTDDEAPVLSAPKGKVITLQRRHMRFTDTLEDGEPLEAVEIFVFVGSS